MSLSSILTEAYYFFRNHLWQLASFAVPILAIEIGLQLWLGNTIEQMDQQAPEFNGTQVAVVMTILLLFTLLIAALTLFMELRTAGHQPPAPALIKHSLPYIPGLLLAGVLSGLAIAAPTMLLSAFGPAVVIGLGISAYLGARLAYVNFMLVVERLSPLQAIRESFMFSQAFTGKTIAVLLLYLPFMMVESLLASAMPDAPFIFNLVLKTVIGFFSLYVNVALFRLYRVNRSLNQA
ncbi:hypothetical protein JYB87_01080 [Shewanella avicenniae]|uniref:Intracellular septation protein A n=1 Tax=Shewanella avicenniae TaxID=2814294 RepID=A0ABX7QT68_9GAMM|nr:hypothetical protein [Shewanella avicenniae]QSX33878.1 hypothetical protein JYB87_01080 [Shewanella avicenniae]